VRANEAERLVEHEEQALGVVEGRAVNLDFAGRGLLRGVFRDRSAHGDASGVDPGPRFAAAAVAEIGEKLIEAAHERVDRRQA
jgi:hypothetical protein